ncbi:hypothetical protein [Trichormus sp. NMC-1]|uniref:hypothetical protein n=1 Tax=Trichormus sp. NMC-1 TaxID=1853259 RepID=UPI0008DC25A6|nr:hypothetical protein [Trichormus sp. NMC-1]
MITPFVQQSQNSLSSPQYHLRKKRIKNNNDLCALAIEMGFLPHTNVGPLSFEEMRKLKKRYQQALINHHSFFQDDSLVGRQMMPSDKPLPATGRALKFWIFDGFHVYSLHLIHLFYP